MMNIYIQSKSGDFNTETTIAAKFLVDAFLLLRSTGGYYDEEDRFVPFEEIQYIKKSDGWKSEE